MQLIIIGEYLYFRYLKYLVIAFFLLLGGGAIGLCPFFFGHSEKLYPLFLKVDFAEWV